MLFGNLPDSQKHRDIKLAPDGNLYCIPFQVSYITKINPDTREVTQLHSSDFNSVIWEGSIVANNGNIYAFPQREDTPTILEISLGNFPKSILWCTTPYYNNV